MTVRKIKCFRRRMPKCPLLCLTKFPSFRMYFVPGGTKKLETPGLPLIWHVEGLCTCTVTKRYRSSTIIEAKSKELKIEVVFTIVCARRIRLSSLTVYLPVNRVVYAVKVRSTTNDVCLVCLWYHIGWIDTSRYSCTVTNKQRRGRHIHLSVRHPAESETGRERYISAVAKD